MRLFVDYIATKKVIAAALGSIVGGAAELYAYVGRADHRTRCRCSSSARGASGDIRADVDPSDLLRALVGFTYGNAGPAGGPARCA